MSPHPKRRTKRVFFPPIPKASNPLVKAVSNWQSTAKKETKVFHFVRHAEAEHNTLYDLEIHDPVLTKDGEEQARKLAERTLGNIQQTADMIMTSPARSCLATTMLGFPDLVARINDIKLNRKQKGKVRVTCDLKEIGPEPAASTTVPLLSLRRQQNGLWQDLDFDYATSHRGKTEGRYGWNREAVRERIECFIVSLWYNDAKEIVIVSHGDFMREVIDHHPTEIPATRTQWHGCEIRSYQFSAESAPGVGTQWLTVAPVRSIGPLDGVPPHMPTVGQLRRHAQKEAGEPERDFEDVILDSLAEQVDPNMVPNNPETLPTDPAHGVSRVIPGEPPEREENQDENINTEITVGQDGMETNPVGHDTATRPAEPDHSLWERIQAEGSDVDEDEDYDHENDGENGDLGRELDETSNMSIDTEAYEEELRQERLREEALEERRREAEKRWAALEEAERRWLGNEEAARQHALREEAERQRVKMEEANRRHALWDEAERQRVATEEAARRRRWAAIQLAAVQAAAVREAERQEAEAARQGQGPEQQQEENGEAGHDGAESEGSVKRKRQGQRG